MNNETVNNLIVERSAYFVLDINLDGDVPTAEVTTVRGLTGQAGIRGGNTEISGLSTSGANPSVEFFNGLHTIVFGQIHSHNDKSAVTSTVTNSQIITETTSNGYGLSPDDISSSTRFPIYAIDLFSGTLATPTSGPLIHNTAADPTGKPNSASTMTTNNQTIGQNLLNRFTQNLK